MLGTAEGVDEDADAADAAAVAASASVSATLTLAGEPAAAPTGEATAGDAWLAVPALSLGMATASAPGAARSVDALELAMLPCPAPGVTVCAVESGVMGASPPPNPLSRPAKLDAELA